MIVEQIKKKILLEVQNKGQKLPSIRKLSQNLQVSFGSVTKAYQELVAEGSIVALHGKGFFLGDAPIDSTPIEPTDMLEELFEQDLENGYLNTFAALPSLKELSIHYKTSTYHIRRFIKKKVAQGILQKVGSSYSFTGEKNVDQTSYILFIHRSDALGHFLIESEREQEVFRTFTAFAQEHNIGIHFVGYHENTDKLIFSNPVPYNDSKLCLGAFISTWLIDKPSRLFKHFAKFKGSISVWWEQPIKEFPRTTRNKKKWAYFNVSFNKNVGILVGNYLVKQGIREINYLSPFHASVWSQKRLEGLKMAGLKVQEFTNREFASPYDFEVFANSHHTTPEKALKKAITNLKPLTRGKGNLFVCANDWVAANLIEISEQQNFQRPHVFGFDNSTESYRYHFDSFAFNVDSMVQDAFYHIISPSKYAIFKSQIQNPAGKIVQKG
ncbi:MAG: GntR family transcriptional regulator [Fibrobacter sp.]|nr:GntR family transcriptional regulator [Fibrobacter sp.]